MRSVELFTGAGGLAMGLSLAGFHHEAIVEWDRYACETIRENKRLNHSIVSDWPDPIEVDVRDFDYGVLRSEPDLIAGGPPCQPFSLGGKHRGFSDNRDMFPEAVRSIRELTPKAFVFENVRGLLRKSFTNYLSYIKLQLTHPDLVRRSNESWTDHLARLEEYHTRGKHGGLKYNVVVHLANAADFGVPQKRDRVFIVGFREGLGQGWHFPRETHSHDALLRSQWVTGEYWDRHEIPNRKRPRVPDRLSKRVRALAQDDALEDVKPWKTIRDALVDLPDPELDGADQIPNHVFMPGARSYPGHTGSPLDEPAKTLKAGDHGVPGGENMLRDEKGRVRYFTVRESSRLQSFPDDFVFHGSWTETMRQLGNAVPVGLSTPVALSIQHSLGQ